jgi:hypothetical protein
MKEGTPKFLAGREPAREGDGAPKSANPMVRVPLPEHAGASRRSSRDVSGHRAPLRLKAGSNSALSAVSQLLAGTLSGPGGSPGAARVPMLRARARRRRTPSRLTNAS